MESCRLLWCLAFLKELDISDNELREDMIKKPRR